MNGNGVRSWLAYCCVRGVFAVMQVFPVKWNLRTARLAAAIWKRVLPRHRNRSMTHLELAFNGSKSLDQLATIADQSLESTAMFAVESACMPRLITPYTWSKYLQLSNHGELVELLIAGKGVILVTGHYGSFELSAHLLAAMGFPVAAVMRPLDNVYLNRFLVETRRLRGMTLIDKKGAANRAETLLSSGYAVAFVGDQDAGRKGMFVDFFGHPASTYKSIGLLAMSTGCPIVVGYTRRRGENARYELGVQRVIRQEQWERAEDPLRWITQQYTTALEEVVREAPEQYLWIHRRWKSKPRAKEAGTTESATPQAHVHG